MDVSHLLDPLNDAQRQAVTAPLAPTLVLAGAGSGKTRVLTHRVAWLVQVEGVVAARHPRRHLHQQGRRRDARAHRGAARHARRRRCGSAPSTASRTACCACTGARPACRRVSRSSTPRTSSAWSSGIIRGAGARRGALGAARGHLVHQRAEGRGPAAEAPQGRRRPDAPPDDQAVRGLRGRLPPQRRGGLRRAAAAQLRAAGATTPGLVEHYRARFGHVLVDEFQDTNTIQYDWMKPLVGATSIPFVVGDDDQSIYRWRGARVENLQQFRRDFPGAQLFRLEQNYRSTGTSSPPPTRSSPTTAAASARSCGPTAARASRSGSTAPSTSATRRSSSSTASATGSRAAATARDAAILYRSNAQSRVFEEYLLAAAHARTASTAACGSSSAQEIKDALAYLRLIANRDDDASFERVVNLPTRGIGARTLEVLRAHARANSRLAVELVRGLRRGAGRAGHGRTAGVPAADRRLDADTRDLPLHEQVDHVIQASGLVEHYQKDKADKGEARLENLEELVSAARGFEPEDGDMPPLDGVPRARGARVRRGPGRGVGGLRADDDAALGQGPRVPGGVPVRPRGRPVPAPALDHWTWRASRRNGASATWA